MQPVTLLRVLAASRWLPILGSIVQLRRAEKAVFAYRMRKTRWQCFQVRLKLYHYITFEISFQLHFNISENVYFTGVCVKCPRKAVARNGGHLEYSDTLKGHFKCAWIHYKSILKLCHQPDNLLIRETLGNPSLQTRLDNELSYSHDILQPSACLAIAIGHTHHLQFGVKI